MNFSSIFCSFLDDYTGELESESLKKELSRRHSGYKSSFKRKASVLSGSSTEYEPRLPVYTPWLTYVVIVVC